MKFSFRKDLTIKEEVFYTILFFYLTVLIIFGSFLSYNFISTSIEKSRDSIRYTNSAINTHITGHIMETVNTINVLSQNPDIINSGAGNFHARRRALDILKSFADTNRNIEYIYAGYSDGSLLINDKSSPPGFDSTRSPWYINAVLSRKTDPGWTLYRDAVSMEWKIAFSRILADSKGGIKGATAIDINVKDLEKLLSEKKNFNTEHSYIIDSTGRVIVHPNDEIIGRIVPEVKSRITGENGELDYCMLHGKTMSYYSTVPSVQWIIITAVDPWEIKHPIIRHLITFLLIVIMLSLLLGIISNRIFSKRFAEPLIELNRRVQDITSGKTADANPYKYSNYETAMIAANIEKLADDALRESEEKYSLIANNIADTVTILDLQMNIIFITPSIEKLKGLTAEEAMAQNIEEKLTPASLKLAFEMLAKELQLEKLGTADPGRSVMLELEEYKKDGSVIWVENRISFIRDESGKAASLLIISRDITARKDAEDKLREAKRQAEDANIAKSQFLAGMSHEIRTPLNAILGMTDLSLMTENDDLIREYLSIVKISGNHLLKILNDILDFSKIEAGNLLLDKREFPLGQIFLFIEKIYRIDIEKKGIAFILDTSENLPPRIVGDEIRIRQMLINLMSNAVKFTESGSIVLSASGKESKSKPGFISLEISVTDTGCGIDPDKHEMIFSKFQQAEMSTSRRFGGSGLGLSIVKELAALMQGDITVESTPGIGSRFTLSFLVEDPAFSRNNGISPEAASREAAPARNLNILLAEDDEINIKLAVALLKKLGDEVTVARSGIEALEALKNRTFDLILMDIEMPEMDGIEATLKIRGGFCCADKADIPIVAMTAHALSDVRQRGLDAGMNGYITKPVDITQINEKIINVIKKDGESLKSGKPPKNFNPFF